MGIKIFIAISHCRNPIRAFSSSKLSNLSRWQPAGFDRHLAPRVTIFFVLMLHKRHRKSAPLITFFAHRASLSATFKTIKTMTRRLPPAAAVSYRCDWVYNCYLSTGPCPDLITRAYAISRGHFFIQVVSAGRRECCVWAV